MIRVIQADNDVAVEEDEIAVFDELTVDDATVIQADIECINGVIHVIDSVLSPE